MYFVVGNILNQERRCLLSEYESQETSLQLKAVWSIERMNLWERTPVTHELIGYSGVSDRINQELTWERNILRTLRNIPGKCCYWSLDLGLPSFLSQCSSNIIWHQSLPSFIVLRKLLPVRSCSLEVMAKGVLRIGGHDVERRKRSLKHSLIYHKGKEWVWHY